MNKELAAVAQKRAVNGIGPEEPGWCQRWVRLCIEEVYGDRWDAYMRDSALHTARAFLGNAGGLSHAGVRVIESSRIEDTQIGDLLYCTEGHGSFGHVGIRVEGNKVAENSVRHTGRTHGAIGFCPLSDFGFALIVRLPAPAPVKR